MNPTIKWLDSVRGSDSMREVARKIGTTHATLNRQANDDSLSFELVRSISYAYGRPVLADLVATGHLAPADVGLTDTENALHAATDEQLVLEIARRLEVVDVHGLFDQPLSAATEAAANVHPLRRPIVRPQDEDLREVAFDSDIDHSQDTDDYTP